jgi:hypothetical protein
LVVYNPQMIRDDVVVVVTEIDLDRILELVP